MNQEARLYLASASPRRRELLAQIGIDHEQFSVDVDETPHSGETPEGYVIRLALAKARAGWRALADTPRLGVLGADTAVVVDQAILGKPRDRDHGLAMLRQLSGRRHRVLSAVALVWDRGQETRLSESRVWMRPLSEAECRAYWATGEPADKAGAYAIQGRAAAFVERLEGSYSGVMGLPLFETCTLLHRVGIAP